MSFDRMASAPATQARRGPPPPPPARRVAATVELESFAVGDVVDQRYELLEHIAAGAIGVVYRAVHRVTKRVVAVKLMHPWLCEDPGLVERTAREARFAGSIRHPNIVEILDAGRTPKGFPFIAMEHLVGWTLREHLQRSSRLTIAAAAQLFAPIVAAVAAAHVAGIVHRDLKPANIMLIEGEQGPIPKVLDFGLAGAIATAQERQRLTNAGTVIGTLGYMAPEQATGASPTPAFDVYALGVLLHELLTGVLPFDGADDSELIRAKLIGDFDESALVRAGVPTPWRVLVSRCLAYDPKARPTAQTLHRELALLGTGRGPGATHAVGGRFTRTRAALLALGLAMTGVTAAVLVWQ